MRTIKTFIFILIATVYCLGIGLGTYFLFAKPGDNTDPGGNPTGSMTSPAQGQIPAIALLRLFFMII